MYINLLVLNSAAAAVFFALFFGTLKGYSNQNVSRFWAFVHEESKSASYFAVMWLAAATAVLPLLSDNSPGYAAGRLTADLMQHGDVLSGALLFALWSTGTMGSAVFVIGTAGYALYQGVRTMLRLPEGPTIVG